jgi:hypothetical protein
MVEDIYDEVEGTKAKKKKGGKRKAGGTKKKSGGAKKEDNNLFIFIVGIVIILGIVGVLFGYTKDKFGELNLQGGTKTQSLEGQINDLKSELKDLSDRSEKIALENEYNKEVVIDLFDKNRKLPVNPDIANWQVLNNESLSFVVSYPVTWTTSEPVINEEKDDQGELIKKEEMINLQPIEDENFVNAVTLKTDYQDFVNLELAEKLDIFQELDSLDTFSFENGEMIYFINIDKNNQEIPTIIILTDTNIYRMTFNITDKKAPNYFKHREQFESMAISFILNTELDLDDDLGAEETPE